ncbi:MAG: translation initiation factor IF-6 [Candidatus Aenigmarchaeota archaeon]|nr:translation initiation factor IF-6 [Candidatus Aenigmarchaeota archaeon]
MRKLTKTDFEGDVNLGIYCLATDKICLSPIFVKEKKLKVLQVPVVKASIANTPFLGMFVAANSKKAIIPDIATEEEKKNIEKSFDDVLVLNTKYNTFGNLILVNDKGCLISSLLKNQKDKIESFLNLKTEIVKTNILKIVGSASVCTNDGCLVHPDATEEQIKQIEDILGVKADIGTVNFGSAFVRSGIIVNKNGAVVGSRTSGPELARITEVFGFL